MGDASSDDGGLPFASIGGAFRWWFAPLGDSRHWMAAWYLTVGVVWGLVMFVVTLVAALVTFGLAFVLVGFLLVVPVFALVNALTSVERSRASWVGDPIAERSRRVAPSGLLRSIPAALTDPERWRQVGFVCAFVVVTPLLFALALMAWVVIIVVVVSVLADPAGIDLIGIVLAVVLLGAAPRINIAVAGLCTTFVAWFLGPDSTAELAGRVEELSAQRDEILQAVAAERRRIERNLHDGVQQQLVALGIDIGRAQVKLDDDPEAAAALLDAAKDTLRATIGEMRVIGRGLHPAVLSDRGLDAALSSIVASAPIPIGVSVEVTSVLSDDTAATAYYVVSEAVANILKHARARTASVRVTDEPLRPGAIRITVHDDGRGGAQMSNGTGLVGIRARVEGADGSLQIDSPSGGPTTLVAVLPTQVATSSPDVIDAS